MQLIHTWLPAATPDSDNPLQIIAAEGSYLYTRDGQKLYDAISSWWCKPLGHRHPLVKESLETQLKIFEHHLPANAYNATIEQLSTLLVGIFTQMDKVIYASDGSSAIEIAMKLSYETRVLQGGPQRCKYLALSGAYHGETIFTLGVCGIANYTQNYQALISQNMFIEDIVYVDSRKDPAWDKAPFDSQKLEQFFNQHGSQITALLIEPVVQGAAGLKIISRDYLRKLINLARAHGIHIIADEIMVGLGRLGYFSVSKDLLQIEPDLVCFAKHLTAGSIPMSSVVVNRSISDICRKYKQIFPHSHTHSCNTLAAAVAVDYLSLLHNSNTLANVREAETILIEFNAKLKQRFPFIASTRAIGAIAAWELKLSPKQIRLIVSLAKDLEILLRPIGNIVYLLPPIYNILEDLAILLPKIETLMEILYELQTK